MKKVLIHILIISFVFVAIWSALAAYKYKKQVTYLNMQIENLNVELAELRENKQEDISSTSNLHPIEIKVQECMKKENYTTAGMSYCVYDSVNDWDKDINASIELLEKILTKEQYELLLKSQKEWKEYKDVQWQLNRLSIESKVGTIYINILAGTNVAIIEARARELRALYDLLAGNI